MDPRNPLRPAWLPLRLALLLGTRLLLGAEVDDAEVSESRDWFRRRLAEAVQGSAWLRSPTAALEAAAKGGAAGARLALAQRLENGLGMPADFHRAETLVREAAESGDAKSQFLMGRIEAADAFSPGGVSIGNPRRAEEWWEKAAGQGHVQAMVHLGSLYRTTSSMRDHGKAAQWFLKAAELGDVPAMRQYGEIRSYDYDELERNEAEAEKWLRKASSHGDGLAMYRLARFLEGSPARKTEGLAWMRRAATAGDELAAREIERREFAARILDPKLMREAWLSLPKAESGLLLALASTFQNADSSPGFHRRSEVARMLDGRDPTPLIRVLVDLHREAAPANLEALRSPRLALPADDVVITDAGLCFDLAELYWNGSGSVQRDRQRAVAWFLRSAQRGDVRAMKRIASLWREGSAGKPDPVEADRWEARAAALGRKPH